MTTVDWHDAHKDPPPLRDFVILCTETHYHLWGRVCRTLYLGWLDQDDDGKVFWWCDAAGKELRNVMLWHMIPALPEELQ